MCIQVSVDSVFIQKRNFLNLNASTAKSATMGLFRVIRSQVRSVVTCLVVKPYYLGGYVKGNDLHVLWLHKSSSLMQ